MCRVHVVFTVIRIVVDSCNKHLILCDWQKNEIPVRRSSCQQTCQSHSLSRYEMCLWHVTVVSMRVHYFVTESDIVRLTYTPVVQKYEKRLKEA